MNLKGQLDMVITSGIVFFVVVFVMVFFIFSTLGFSVISGEDQGQLIAGKVIGQREQIDSRALMEVFLTEEIQRVKFNDEIETKTIYGVLLNWTLSFSKKDGYLFSETEWFPLIEEKFKEEYSCDDKNTLLLNLYSTTVINEDNAVFTYLNYPEVPYNSVSHLLFSEISDRKITVKESFNGAYPQNIEGDLDGYYTLRLDTKEMKLGFRSAGPLRERTLHRILLTIKENEKC